MGSRLRGNNDVIERRVILAYFLRSRLPHLFPPEGRAADRLFSWKGCGSRETSPNGERVPGRADPVPGVLWPPRLRVGNPAANDWVPAFAGTGGAYEDAGRISRRRRAGRRKAAQQNRHGSVSAPRGPWLVNTHALKSGGVKGAGCLSSEQSCHPGQARLHRPSDSRRVRAGTQGPGPSAVPYFPWVPDNRWSRIAVRDRRDFRDDNKRRGRNDKESLFGKSSGDAPL
jgi:hypothetical protein